MGVGLSSPSPPAHSTINSLLAISRLKCEAGHPSRNNNQGVRRDDLCKSNRQALVLFPFPRHTLSTSTSPSLFAATADRLSCYSLPRGAQSFPPRRWPVLWFHSLKDTYYLSWSSAVLAFALVLLFHLPSDNVLGILHSE